MAPWNEWWRKWNGMWSKALRALALSLIHTYRLFGATIFSGGVCRFQPTCSVYALEAFDRHPPLTAFGLTLRRLGRCHPFGAFGPDPVPERKSN